MIARPAEASLIRFESDVDASDAMREDRTTASRIRQLLAVLVMLMVIAGVGGLMIARTRV
jgi:hypothetical protein